jgi:nucleoside-diphosphate-sugar epimerase
MHDEDTRPLESDTHLIFGAGPSGLATARALRTLGAARIVVVSRHRPAGLPPGVRHIEGDVLSSGDDGAASIVAAENPDVVYGCLNAPYTRWATDFPPLQSAIVAAVLAQGRRRRSSGQRTRLVVLDNLYAYAPSSTPLQESSLRQPTSRKGQVRLAMDNALRAAAAEADEAGLAVDVVVGRAADFFGPDVAQSGLGERQLDAMIEGKAAEVVGDPEMAHAFSFIDDVGRGLALLGTQPLPASARTFHLPVMPALPLRELIDNAAAMIALGNFPLESSPSAAPPLARRVPRATRAGRPTELQRKSDRSRETRSHGTVTDGLIDTPARLKVLSATTTARLAKVIPIVREVHEMRFQWDRPFLVDDSAFFAAFGAAWAEHFGRASARSNQDFGRASARSNQDFGRASARSNQDFGRASVGSNQDVGRTGWDEALRLTVAGRQRAVAAKNAARSQTRRAALAAFVVDNIWIGVLGLLVLSAPRLWSVLAGKETMIAVAMGLYWAPRLRAVTLRLVQEIANRVRAAQLRLSGATAARALVIGSAAVVALASSACSGAPGRLSETVLYDDIANKELNARAEAFAPRFVLWSDGAEKDRWVIFPEDNDVVDTDDMDAWIFPVGTRFFKEFRRDGKRVETRMLEKTEGGWVNAAYVWSDDESDATLTPFFGQENVRGTAHDAPWGQSCTFCHGDAELPLGFTAIQLARDGDAAEDEDDLADGLTLQKLMDQGRLTSPPTQPLQLPGDSLTQQALGILHVNCGSCHADTGSQADEIVRMRLTTTTMGRLEDTNVFRTAVGQDSSGAIDGRLTYLAPGKPDDSLIVYRLSARGNDAQMPPTGTEVVDEDAVRVLRAFVESLAP